jgi:hypothetical protein
LERKLKTYQTSLGFFGVVLKRPVGSNRPFGEHAELPTVAPMPVPTLATLRRIFPWKIGMISQTQPRPQ